MRRLFLLGTGPLLEDGATVMSGQCLRTWHFAAPLLARHEDYEVHLMTVPIPGTTRDEVDPPAENADYQGFRYTRLLSNDQNRILPVIAEYIERSRPDALVGINAYPAYLLSWLRMLQNPRMGRPLWADLNGWTMAEAQVAVAAGNKGSYSHFWRMEALTLLAADRFSTVTDRQAYALYGELAMIGRLTGSLFAEEMAVSVANAVYPDYARLERRAGLAPVLKGRVPPGARVVLWSGGFNSWTDIPLLRDALKRAMESEPSLHFVATGGAIVGHDEATHALFQSVAADLPADRVHALGWIDFRHVLELHATAHVGINIDGANTETRFGARNRLTNMMGAGLPVITTRGTEIAEWIERHGLGAVVPLGDAAGLADVLVESVRDSGAWQERAARARRAALRDFAPEATLASFLAWVAAPAPARDTGDAADSASAMRAWVLRRAAMEQPFAGLDRAEATHGGGEPPTILSKFIRKLKGASP